MEGSTLEEAKRPGWGFTFLTLGLLVVGLSLIGFGLLAQHPAPPRPLHAGTAPGPSSPGGVSPLSADTGVTGSLPAGAGGDAAASGPGAALPARVEIPRLGIAGPVEPLGLNATGNPVVPKAPTDIGWYRDSVPPGERGTSVLYGHVTWEGQPATFFRLAEIAPGDKVRVRRSDGSVAVFSVYGIAEYRKKEFPSDQVYGATSEPTLRLITCSGEYDQASDSYRSNLVVYAVMIRASSS